MVLSAKKIAVFLNGRVEGDDKKTVSSFAGIEEGKEDCLSFLSNAKYLPQLYALKSGVVIINDDIRLDRPVAATLIRVPNAYKSAIQLLKLYTSLEPKETGISELAFISPKAQIGENVYVGPFVFIDENVVVGDGSQLYPGVYIGKNAVIGKNTVFYANASIYKGCKIGNNVIAHSGSVIGSDGFGFVPNDEGYEKVPHIGTVIIEDDVEIGANTCIDRGTVGATIIHKRVKLDNLVHIAHNAEIGSNTVMSAQVGIAGSTKVGENCMFGGQVGVAGHITIGNRVLLGAKSGVPASLKDNQQLIGTPPMGKIPFFKSHALLKQLPELYAEMEEMNKRVCEVESKLKIVDKNN